jgi:hypothetical protein
MFNIIKKNFNGRDFVERLVAIAAGIMAGWWISMGSTDIAFVIIVIAMIDPKWFGND